MANLDVFCERCGNRQPADPPRRGAKLSRMLESVGLAEPPRRSQEHYLRLCLACRGYSCPSCWNEDARQCQTCAPLPGAEVLYESAHETPPVTPLAFDTSTYVPSPFEAGRTETALERVTAWTDDALLTYPGYEPEWSLEAEFEPEPVFVAEPEPVGAIDSWSEPDIAFRAPVPEPFAPFEAEPVREQEAGPERVVGFEMEPEAEPEPVVAFDVGLDFEPAAEVEPDPVTAALLAEPEPEPTVEPATPAVLEAPVTPLDPLPPLDPWKPLRPARPLPPPAVRPRIEFDAPPPPAFMIARDLPPLRPPPVSLPTLSAEPAPPATRNCSTCDLPLSARANFCRRCGTQRAASA